MCRQHGDRQRLSGDGRIVSRVADLPAASELSHPEGAAVASRECGSVFRMAGLALQCAIRTDVGRRANNEDAVFATSRLAVVADGVGGSAAGEVASRMVVHALHALDKSRLLSPLPDAFSDALRWANESLGFLIACRPEHAGMASTVTAVALSEDNQYLVANVGDSRTYLMRDGQLNRLTRDDSLVQELLDRGAITKVDARDHPQRSVVLDALDGHPRGAIRPSVLTARAGDRLLLCSDGLSDTIRDPMIGSILQIASRKDCADALVERALDHGARDNVSVIVADVEPRVGTASGWVPALQLS